MQGRRKMSRRRILSSVACLRTAKGRQALSRLVRRGELVRLNADEGAFGVYTLDHKLIYYLLS